MSEVDVRPAPDLFHEFLSRHTSSNGPSFERGTRREVQSATAEERAGNGRAMRGIDTDGPSLAG